MQPGEGSNMTSIRMRYMNSSDMNEYMDCYFTGVTLGYQPTPSQELRLQVTDNRIGSMEDTYGILPAGIEKPRAPLLLHI